jgi:hypothetical protein
MPLTKLFLAGNTSALGEFFPDQKQKIPGNPKIPAVFPARKSLIRDITGFLAGDGDHTLTAIQEQLPLFLLF